MKFDLVALFGNMVSWYAKLPLAQKVAWPLFIAGSMFVIVFISRWAGRPDYAMLYSDLEQGDAASVVESLKDKKVSYLLRDDGRTIDVSPPESVHDLRLELASAGLPKNGKVGLELFSGNLLGMTGMQEQINLIRGTQGELERTIGSIEAVRSVRVHITKPDKSAFIKKDVLPTASVLLKLKGGMELTKEQVKGIANLVAGSVERLLPENVTILDSRGNLLNEKRTEEQKQGADTTQLDYQRSLEASLMKRIESMLSEILGPGKAVARVTAELDFSKQEKEEEAFDPGSQVARSERSVFENASGSQEGGVPGISSNITNAPGLLSAPDSAQGSGRRELVKNFEVSRAISRTVSAVGKLSRLSVAVLVDGQYSNPAQPAAGAEASAAIVKNYKPLTPEMLRQIDSLVKQAVGFDPDRGDTVTVENIRFFEADESLEQALQSGEGVNLAFKALAIAGPILLGILFFLIVVRPLVRLITSPTEAEVDLSRLLPGSVEELEAELEAERGKASSIIPDANLPAINIEELEELLAENSKIVRDNPQHAALLIRYWINDGRM